MYKVLYRRQPPQTQSYFNCLVTVSLTASLDIRPFPYFSSLVVSYLEPALYYPPSKKAIFRR